MTTYPLLDSQLGILLACGSRPHSTAWNLPSVIEFDKTVDVMQLMEAMGRICAARPELHIQFVRTASGEIRQYADTAMPIPLDLKRMTNEEANAYMREGFVRPFTLFGKEALCRFEIVQTDTRVLLLSDLHHSIADGFTIAGRLMGNDVAAAYGHHPLILPRMTLFDWAQHEHEMLQTPVYERAKAYYQELFANCDATHLFATASDAWGKRLSTCFRTNIEHIRKWCEKHDASPHHLLMAAFCLTLSKLSHQKSMVFSTINHGRYDKRLSAAYGMFVSTIPFVVDIDEEMTIYDLMAQIKRRLMQGLRHRTYPYTHFCQDIGIIPRVSFAFQSDGLLEQAIIDGKRFKGWQLTGNETANDLSVTVYTVETDYEVRIDASDALYQTADLERFGHAMHECLGRLMEDDRHPIGQTDIIDSQQKTHLLALSKGEQTDIPRGETVVSLFLRQADKTPEALAVDDTRQTLTYDMLRQQSGALAQWLKTAGVGNGTFVGIDTKPCCAFLVGTLAIMRAGGAYVPIAPNLPPKRRQHIIDDAAITIILDEDSITTHSTAHPTADTINLSQPQGAAYMIYTSGTTGTPKGVVIRHEGLTNLIHFCVRRWPLTPKSRIACHATMAFDASVEDLFPVLTIGGCVMPVPEEIRTDIDALARFIDEHHITGGCYTTNLGVALARSHPLHVDYLCVGGERLLTNPSVEGRVYNTYGPTEFTVDATYCELEKGKTYDDIPIGRPLDNCHAFVTDPYGRLLPQGAVGELWLAGPQTAAGYWNDPELTARKFTACSFYDGTVYHTGDLVRWNDDGMLEYVGRKDNQVKIDGIRINFEETERRMLDIPGIIHAAVVAHEMNGKTRLLAYYTTGHDITEKEIVSMLRLWLPPQMIPTRFIALEEMPLTPSGKTDRRRLPRYMPDTIPGEAPRNDTEAALCMLFSALLDEKTIAATDNFFNLGGTSLIAMQLVTEARKKGIELNYSDIFDYPTPRLLASQTAAQDTDGNEDIDGYDYRAIDKLLTEDSTVTAGHPGGKLLLTGGTGFLGIHLLRHLLSSGKWEITCMIRCPDMEEAWQRLRERWAYYFDETLPEEHLAGIVYGDLTSEKSIMTLARKTYDLVVNCAADIRFYAKDDNIRQVNSKGVEYLAQMCANTQTPLIHISTLSVGGFGSNSGLPTLTPRMLYRRQRFYDQYSRAKFMAERYLLEKMAHGKLKGTIIRMGHLTPTVHGKTPCHAPDGLLPAALHAMADIGGIPASAQHIMVGTIAVDQAAARIEEIITSTEVRRVWHVGDENRRPLIDLAEHLAGKPLQVMGDEAFAEQLRNTTGSQLLAPLFEALSHKKPPTP
ncbi:MAG: amino acid adenylation domain-containing protein [Prevotella sp.]|nr:amino acid adenylation domain-containing protein [Prevotella sp.]